MGESSPSSEDECTPIVNAEDPEGIDRSQKYIKNMQMNKFRRL